MNICELCDRHIKYSYDNGYWIHIGGQYRHPAIPKDIPKGQFQSLDYLRLAIMRCESEKIHKEKLANEIVKTIKEIYGK